MSGPTLLVIHSGAVDLSHCGGCEPIVPTHVDAAVLHERVRDADVVVVFGPQEEPTRAILVPKLRSALSRGCMVAVMLPLDLFGFDSVPLSRTFAEGALEIVSRLTGDRLTVWSAEEVAGGARWPEPSWRPSPSFDEAVPPTLSKYLFRYKGCVEITRRETSQVELRYPTALHWAREEQAQPHWAVGLGRLHLLPFEAHRVQQAVERALHVAELAEFSLREQRGRDEPGVFASPWRFGEDARPAYVEVPSIGRFRLEPQPAKLLKFLYERLDQCVPCERLELELGLGKRRKPRAALSEAWCRLRGRLGEHVGKPWVESHLLSDRVTYRLVKSDR